MKIKVAKIEISRIRLGRPNFSTTLGFLTLDCLKDYFSYTLETGRSYNNEKGAKKVSPNEKIKTFKSLLSNLDKAAFNSCRCYQSTFYSILEEGYVDSKDLDGISEDSEEFQNLVHTL